MPDEKPYAVVTPETISMPYFGAITVEAHNLPPSANIISVRVPVRTKPGQPFDPLYASMDAPLNGNTVNVSFQFKGVPIDLAPGSRSVVVAYTDASGRFFQVHGGNLIVE